MKVYLPEHDALNKDITDMIGPRIHRGRLPAVNHEQQRTKGNDPECVEHEVKVRGKKLRMS
jgi:hypothetical protein